MTCRICCRCPVSIPTCSLIADETLADLEGLRIAPPWGPLLIHLAASETWGDPGDITELKTLGAQSAHVLQGQWGRLQACLLQVCILSTNLLSARFWSAAFQHHSCCLPVSCSHTARMTSSFEAMQASLLSTGHQWLWVSDNRLPYFCHS